MQKMVSEVRSIPLNSLLPLYAAKEGQDAATSKLASDRSGVVGVGDIDLTRFLTKPFEMLRMFQAGSGNDVVGTLALIPQNQIASNANPFYTDGNPMALDRAGSGVYGFNIARTGRPPDGYGKGSTKIVQKRFGRRFNPAIDRVSYYIVARLESVDYVLQSDERLDGDFFPGSIEHGVGAPYGQFDTQLYNGSPFTADGWTGVAHAVPDNLGTRPQISSISPDSVTRPNTGGTLVAVTGTRLSNCGFVFFGPYLAGVTSSSFTSATPNPPGSYHYHDIVSDTQMFITTPTEEMEAGTYTLHVIGSDGQIGTFDSFTVLPGPGE